MKDEKVIRTRALKLSDNATVFQAELQAIRLGCSIIKECNNLDKVITFMVDSKAALMALDNVDTSSELVKHTKNAINELANTHEIHLRWIKAHVDHKGNEIADAAAKTGCTLQNEQNIKPSRAHIKSLINDEMYKIWNQRW